MFPSLVNCCSINWMNTWTNDALLSVGEGKFADLTFDTLSVKQMQELRPKLLDLAVQIHTNAYVTAEMFYEERRRKVYITPKNYLDTIMQFGKMVDESTENLMNSKDNYQMGIQILIKTKEEVKRMDAELQILKPILDQKKTESEELTIVV